MLLNLPYCLCDVIYDSLINEYTNIINLLSTNKSFVEYLPYIRYIIFEGYDYDSDSFKSKVTEEEEQQKEKEEKEP